jgi:predicted dehydrogenase
MVAAARKYNRVFQCGNIRRSMDKHRAACQMIRAGVLGKIRTVIAANYASPWRCGLPEQPAPKDLDWDVWCGQTEPRAFHRDVFMPRAKPGWISFEPYSGGEVTGWGTHGLDQIQWALDMDETGPVEFWPESDKPLDPPIYTEPEDAKRGERLCSEGHAVSYRYADGVEVRMGDGSPAGGLFRGERGKLWLGNNEFRCNPPELAGPSSLADAPHQGDINTRMHIQNWFDCIKSGERPVADVESAHRAATICHIINITRKLGRRLHWDPEKERFDNDDEANRLLSRPQRKPYGLPEEV